MCNNFCAICCLAGCKLKEFRMNGLGGGGGSSEARLVCGKCQDGEIAPHIKAHTCCPPPPPWLDAPQWSDLNPWYVCLGASSPSCTLHIWTLGCTLNSAWWEKYGQIHCSSFPHLIAMSFSHYLLEISTHSESNILWFCCGATLCRIVENQKCGSVEKLQQYNRWYDINII